MEWIAGILAKLVLTLGGWARGDSANRRSGSKLVLQVDPEPEDERIRFTVFNRGASTPVIAEWSAFTLNGNGGGSALDPIPAPGKTSDFTIPLRSAKTGVNIELTSTDPSGQQQSVRRWYQWTGDLDSDRRTDLELPGKSLRKAFPQRPFDRKPPRGHSVGASG